jgi:hypothetical protein
VAGGVEFEWDSANTKHFAAHKVAAMEFESLMRNSPLVAIWTLRRGKVRAITAFPAGAASKKLFPGRKP